MFLNGQMIVILVFSFLTQLKHEHRGEQKRRNKIYFIEWGRTERGEDSLAKKGMWRRAVGGRKEGGGR